jgi:tRNA(Leu) C34 or U34 (ribose-2'-O)-methylase TrmL
MSKNSRSLNVAVSAGIVLAETRRQLGTWLRSKKLLLKIGLKT